MSKAGKLCLLGSALTLGALSAAVWAQTPAGNRTDRDRLPRPVYRVAQQPAQQQPADPAAADPSQAAGQPAQTPAGQQPIQEARANNDKAAAVGSHPLDPAIQIASEALQAIQGNIVDYSATLVKRERIGGKLGDNEYLFIKVRHQPFSVYTYFLGPSNLKGQEAIYVAGQNNGNLLAHGVGIRKIVGMVSLQPTSMIAMQDNRYPITEIGILNLTNRLLEVAQHDRKYGECNVQIIATAKINGRAVTCIEVVHPVPRREFLFNMARIYIDNELKVPVRYEAYEWPAQVGGQPELLEEYTYLNLKLNNGFNDADFSDRNPNYSFH